MCRYANIVAHYLNKPSIMKKILVVCLFALSLSTVAEARGNKPCSGKKGGVSHCEGTNQVYL